jgi:hypothetical protein
MGASGVGFLILSLLPSIAAMFTTGDFGLLIGVNIWVSLGVAFAVGVGAGVTVLSSGLSGESIMLAFILAFSATLFAILSWNVLAVMNDLPYGIPAIITGFSAFFFALGVFFLATKS